MHSIEVEMLGIDSWQVSSLMHVMPWNVNYGGLIKRSRNVENVTNNTEISWDKRQVIYKRGKSGLAPGQLSSLSLSLSLSVPPLVWKIKKAEKYFFKLWVMNLQAFGPDVNFFLLNFVDNLIKKFRWRLMWFFLTKAFTFTQSMSAEASLVLVVPCAAINGYVTCKYGDGLCNLCKR